MSKISNKQANEWVENPNYTGETDNISNYSDVFPDILNKIIIVLSKMIEEESKKNNKTITDVINSPTFPLKDGSLYKYKRHDVKSIGLDTFYDICQYTNISADYFLGFNDTPSKESSAKQTHLDYGLSYEALDSLKKMYERTKRYNANLNLSAENGYIDGIDFINFLLVTFAPQFILSIYDYFDALDKFEEFKKEYFPKGTLKKKFLSEEEQRLIDEYQDLQRKMNFEKFEIIENVFRFLDSYRKAEKQNTNKQKKR